MWRYRPTTSNEIRGEWGGILTFFNLSTKVTEFLIEKGEEKSAKDLNEFDGRVCKIGPKILQRGKWGQTRTRQQVSTAY